MPPTDFDILVTESAGFASAAAETLQRAANLKLADLDRAGLLREAATADVVWVRLRNRIDAEVMAAAPRLKIIVTPTTGLNHIAVEEAERRGIQVLSLSGETEFLKEVRATAEHTIGLILALVRNTAPAYASALKGEWNRDLFRGAELYGKTVGVVGYGRLGRTVAHYLLAFDTRALAFDPYVDPGAVEAGVELISLGELLQQADIVTLHVNLSEETKGFFGAAELSAMKKGAWLINTSRGELIDEQALLNALSSDHLAGAALDVISDENAAGMENHPLIRYAREHSHLLITPHIGGCAKESMEKTELFLAEKLGRMIAAMPP